jgi:Tol biopolymer transport system component
LSLTPGFRLGGYEIVALIGAGGMGEVYRARDTRLKRDVAIKVLPDAFAHDPERLARFQREAELLATLNHPHIAAVYGLEQTSEVRGIVLELIEGETLAERLERGAIPLSEALDMARQIADALETAHGKGIIHRDLKPGNVKVTSDGTVKVLDFGLAKATEQPQSSQPHAPDVTASPTISTPGMTMRGVILGTAAYMSPEQARGNPVDERADIWAFGCVLYEMLTGRRAFDGRDATEILASVIKSDPQWTSIPAGLPPVLALVLRRCLEKDPKQRMQAIGDVRLALHGALEPAAGPRGAVRSEAVSARFLIAATALAIFAAVIFFIMQGRDNAATTSTQPTLQYQISAPENESIIDAALSPDGRQLAFTTGLALMPATRQLWIRPLDSLQARPLPGTERAATPVWSPDGKRLAFTTNDGLSVVDPAGGPPSVLVAGDTNSDSGVTWSPDGVILFNRPGYSEVFRVSLAGGEPRPATVLDKARREVAHYWPRFLPDGRHFIFTALSSAPAESAVYAASVDSDQRKRLLTINTKCEYAQDANGDGYLLFVRGGTLLAQRFNQTTLELHGDPFAVANNVGVRAGAGGTVRSLFSGSTGGVITFQAGDATPSKELVWLDRSGKRLSTVGEAADYSNPALSPDERHVAISRMDPQLGTRDIWVIDLERAAPRRFTFDRGDDINPVWSPDGRRIAITSDSKGTRDVYVKNSDGSGADETLFDSDAPDNTAHWSPDGLYVLAGRQALPTTGAGKPIPLPSGSKRVSPNGRWLAYQSDESGRSEIYVQSFPELLEGRSTGKWQVSSAGGNYAEWRSDSAELYYVGPDNALMGVTVNSAGPVFQNGVPTPLFRLQIEAVNRRAHFQPAANGQRFLVVQPDEGAFSNNITILVNWTATGRP